MEGQIARKAYDRGIDSSRMADYVYGRSNGRGKPTRFEITQAYQDGRPWTYADYFDRTKSIEGLPPIPLKQEYGPKVQ